MWLKVAAIAALFVTDAVAQPPVRQNCTTQVGNEVFRYCFDTPGLVPATTVFWNPAQGTPPTIEFAFEANGTVQGADQLPPVWRGVGFSNGGPDAMISGQAPPGSNVVMGCVENALPARNFAATPAGADFELTQKNSAGVVSMGNQGLLTYNQQTMQVGNIMVCSVRFSRPVVLDNLPMQSLGDRDQLVIVARGQDGDQGINNAHATDGRSMFLMNFANPANVVQPPDMTTMPTTMPGATMPDNPASTLSASMTLIPAVVGSIYAALW